jgi:alpha-D-ribose 1-methylphosphonate 5-triphosphate diphosphatase PhnM
MAQTADLSNLPNARKLVAAAEAAGLSVATDADDTFTRVAVANDERIVVAEWWTNLREFNYASIKDRATGKERRADSLKQARAAVGI